MAVSEKKGRGCNFDIQNFSQSKASALKCAKQLLYFDKFPELEKQLKNATSIAELNRLMRTARMSV